MEDCEKIISADKKTITYVRDGEVVARYTENKSREEWYGLDSKYQSCDDYPSHIWCTKGKIAKEFWRHDGHFHRDRGPAVIGYKKGQKTSEYWYRDGCMHREYQPAIVYYKDGQITNEHWYHDDKIHRDGQPAVIHYENGQIIEEQWYRDDKLGGCALAYIWLADITKFSDTYVNYRLYKTLDEFRDAVKGPLALELMRPLPIPIRNAIYEHYCLQ